jgi:hypothetical protein
MKTFEEAWENTQKDYSELTASSYVGLSLNRTKELARQMYAEGVSAMCSLQDYRNFNEWFENYGEPEKKHSTMSMRREDLAEKAWEAATYIAEHKEKEQEK